MESRWIIEVGLGVASFAGTNIDDLLLLFFLFSNKKMKTQSIFLGQLLGMFLIIAVSWSSAQIGNLFLPQQWTHFLGIAPITMGIYKLFNANPEKENGESTSQFHLIGGGVQSLTIAVLTFANGGDNIALYMPLFANAESQATFVLIATYLSMTGVWCFVAYYMTKRRTFSKILEKYGNTLLPWLLISLGLLILLEPTFK